MQVVFQVTLAILGSLALACLAIYAYLAYRGRSLLLYSSVDARLLTFPKKVFLALAAVGMLTCVFQGAEGMLWWIPASWGAHDEYGEFTSHRVQLAAVFTFLVGGALVIFIDRSAHKDFFLYNANLERRELKKIFEFYGALPSLELLLRNYSIEMNALEAQLSARGEVGHSALTFAFPEGQLLMLYRELEARVQYRVKELKSTSPTRA